jgi:hypothetical protein
MAKSPVKTTHKKNGSATSAPVLDAASKKPRRLKKPEYKSFRVHKHIKSEGVTVPSAFKLLRRSVGVLARNWKLFLLVSLVYGLLNFVLVQGFSAQNLGDIKDSIGDAGGGSLSWAIRGTSMFAYLLSTASAGSNPGASVYQVMMQIIVSLAIIWMLRQLYASRKVRMRDGFYQGMYPLVPFLLVLVVIVLQAIPATLGIWLYSVVNSNGIAASSVEQILWAIVAFLAILLSLYWICASVMALYVVSLPNMTPFAALRSAIQLVRFRRWAVLRKLLFLPIVLLLVGALVMIPVILLSTAVAPWVFLVVAMFALPVVHSYLYALYRSLL